MAQIVAKAFDATKRIVRSVFLGSPNLFTTSDVNRQIEAFKYQLDQLDDKVGVLSDISWSISDLGSNNYRLTPTFTYLKTKGCDFTSIVSASALDVNLVADTPLYICLFGQTETVTYTDDATHEIAGAKFEDNTSKPAANQIRYKASTVQIAATTTPESAANLIAVLAVMNRDSDQTNYTFKKNTITNEQSALLAGSEQLEFVQHIQDAVLRVGDSFSTAINKVASQIHDFITSFNVTFKTVSQADTLYWRSNTVYTANNNVDIELRNGFLVMHIALGNYYLGDRMTDFMPEESGRVTDLGCVCDTDIIAALEKFSTNSRGTTKEINFGICGYFFRAGVAHGEDINGGWSLVKATLKKREPDSYASNHQKEWVVYLELVDMINPRLYAPDDQSPMAIDNIEVKIEHNGHIWLEAQGPFVVTKEVNVFPLIPFLD